MVKIEDEEENPNDGPGLISCDMGQFGSGTLSDPLRHAVGMRTAQDQYKMQMWNSFPSFFQNTIFHGEQDQQIKQLRHAGTLGERLVRARELKEEGNEALKAASFTGTAGLVAPETRPGHMQEVSRHEIQEMDAVIATKEQELKALRQQQKVIKAKFETARSEMNAALTKVAESDWQREEAQAKGLEKAITFYERSAGLLRYVECVRPDWKNDDGSYKGIEDESLRMDESALRENSSDRANACELVTSCYLNIALASQKLQKFEQMQKACDEVLAKISPQCVKAFYRRAQARIAPLGALDADRSAAIQDLVTAAKLSPQDKDVRTLLTKLRADKRRYESDDRNTFSGMFDRGEVVTNDPREEGDAPKPVDWDLRDPRVQNLLDIRPGPDAYKD